MKISISIVSLVFLFAICPMTFGTVYEIYHNNIADHSDINTVGSIAWYMNEYGGYNTYKLMSSATYYCDNTLYVSGSSTLRGLSDKSSVIACSANWTSDASDYLIRLNWASQVKELTIDGMWRPRYVIYSSSDEIVADNCIIAKSKKADGCHLILFVGASDIQVTNCMLRRAACDSGEYNFERKADILHVNGCSQIVIGNNDMAYAAAGGISMLYCTVVRCTDNLIHNTGQSRTSGYLGDSITGYHNGLGTTDLNWEILRNDIWNSYNHGIHVSGYGIEIEDNAIWSTTLGAHIYIGDWKTSPDCSADCTVKNNYFDNCPATNTSMWIKQYDSQTVTCSGNTGCTTIVWGPTCN
ncbi:MAG: hypothetical protein ACIAQZ_06040 [Sedimentisphaeraceae bacterium JB056]